MAVERLSPPNKHNARVFSLHCVYTDIRRIEECDKRVISIFLCSSPFWKRVNGHRSIDGRFEIIGKQTSSSIVCLYKVLFQFSPVYTIF